VSRSAAVAALAVLAVATGCSGGGRPDVLVVTLDTTRADHLGCYGADPQTTPNLDAFAGEAVRFEQAVSPVPVTLPSHSSMFTGLNPYRHGVRYNLMYVLPEERTTVAERLAAGGYRTGAVVSAMVLSRRFGIDQGFEQFDDIDRVAEGESFDEQPQRRAADSVDRALAWWREHEVGPRFLWLHLYDPHYAYDPPFPFSSRFEGRSYEGEIAYADREVGRLFQAVKAAGDWDRTLVIVAGDHGESLYEHGERWHADLVYQGAMHPPLLIKPPGRGRPEVVGQPVGLVDVGPTILDYAGVEGFPDADGISLRDAIEEGRAPLRPIYFESLAPNLNYGWAAQRGVRYGRFKYFVGGRAELYDLEVDPGEAVDLADSDPERARGMAGMLEPFREREREQGQAEATARFGEEELRKVLAIGYVGTAEAEISELENAVHPPDKAELLSELIRAQALVSRHEWERAAEAYDYILRRDPKNRSALYNRAWSHFVAEEFDESLRLAELLWSIYPASEQAPDLIARIHSRQGRPRRAVEVLTRGLDEHPANAVMRFHRVLAWLEAGEPASAEPDVVWLERNRPEHFSAGLARSMLRAAAGDVPGALESLRRAVEAGLPRLDPVEASPTFEAVRGDPGYRELQQALARRTEKKAED